MEDAEEKPKLYSPLSTVVITLGIFFGAQILAGVLISIIPVIKHWTNAQANSWLQDNAWGMFIFVLLAEVITIGMISFFLKLRDTKFAAIGLGKPKLGHLAYALAGFGVYFLIYIIGLVIIKTFIPSLNLDQKQELGFDLASRGTTLLPIFLSLVILPPIAEEIVARGFLFGGLRAKLPFATAAIITSALFASAHLTEATDGLLWVAAIDTFILSTVLCYLREKTDSLWPSIGVHMLKNGLAFVVLFNIVQYIR